jgi:hypothetical protein
MPPDLWVTTEPMVLRFRWQRQHQALIAPVRGLELLFNCLAVLHGRLFSLQLLDFSLCRLICK